MSLEDIIRKHKSRASVYGGSGNYDVYDTIFTDFEDNPGYRVVKFNDEYVGVHMVDKSGDTKERHMIAKPPIVFRPGDMVADESNVMWLVTAVNNLIYNKATISPCNHTLTYQDKNTLEIHNTPCILEDKTSVYSDGLHENKFIITADDQIVITVPDNEITDLVVIGDRFVFNHDKRYIYKTTRVDRLIEEGLIFIRMRRDTYDAVKDNLELNVADYIKPRPEPEPNGDYEIVIDIPETIIFGESELCTVEVLVDGIEVDDEIGFEMIGNTDIIWLEDIEDRACYVRANNDFQVGALILRVSLVDNPEIYAEKRIKAGAW